MDSANILKQLLLLGVGTTALLIDRLRELTDEWVKQGKIDPQQATDLINEISKRIKDEQVNVEILIQRQIRNVMQDLGVPRQSEIDELRGRIDRLERQVRELENRSWR
ncbi:MAG: phasin family protein [Pseudanabaenaceae cyanobacterium SKYGB_i_bin29]|nr:phasin family protein [Pseudanabaenaceae cyanobacterium SKYG29]MDW8420544.1 phasin family protein [Pseudanabaenaceae cyanobacterium SKYGB_i_bin29]